MSQPSKEAYYERLELLLKKVTKYRQRGDQAQLSIVLQQLSSLSESRGIAAQSANSPRARKLYKEMMKYTWELQAGSLCASSLATTACPDVPASKPKPKPKAPQRCPPAVSLNQKWLHITPDVKHISAAPEHRSGASREEQLLQANRQLRKELQAKAGGSTCGCGRNSTPSHWAPSSWACPMGIVQLVELLLPGQPGSIALPPSVNPWTFMQMVEQGVPGREAVAALLVCGGDGDAALATWFKWHHSGGMPPQHYSAPQLDVWASLAESKRVLHRFASTVARQRKVRRIERVQNSMLWARYAFRQAELRQRHGHRGDNESLLFHGADKATLEAIINEGFDVRVSNAGTLGQGTYFAQASTYCSTYSQATSKPALNQLELTHLQQQRVQGQSAHPAFLPGGHAMLLCRVALGKVTKGSSGLRRAPPGFDSVTRVTSERDEIFAVFDNAQSYPEYLVHYEA